MDELLKKLLSGEGKLSLLLLEAMEIVEDYDNPELLEFIENETNGYYKEAELPEYRKIKGTLVGDLQTPYGGVQKDITLDVSRVSEKIGMDMTVAHVLDDIGFIEGNIIDLTSVMVNRPLGIGTVNSISKLIEHNSPGTKLIAASHKFAKSGLQNIPNKVREELIKGLQKLKKTTPRSKDSVPSKKEEQKERQISVFIGYAWESDDHNERVISFVEFLRNEGYNASMDRMKSQEETAINFNQMMVQSLNDSDKVVVILSPKYKQKADKFEGGVGMEFNMILEDIKSKANKYVFVSFGSNHLGEIVPNGIAGREVLDLKKDQDEHAFNGLFAKLQTLNTIPFSDVSNQVTTVKDVKIKPFKL